MALHSSISQQKRPGIFHSPCALPGAQLSKSSVCITGTCTCQQTSGHISNCDAINDTTRVRPRWQARYVTMTENQCQVKSWRHVDTMLIELRPAGWSLATLHRPFDSHMLTTLDCSVHNERFHRLTRQYKHFWTVSCSRERPIIQCWGLQLAARRQPTVTYTLIKTPILLQLVQLRRQRWRPDSRQ